MKHTKLNFIPALFLLFSFAHASAELNMNSFENEYVPNELIIKFKDSLETKSSLVSTLNSKIKKKFSASGAALYSIPNSSNFKDLALRIQSDPEIEYVELNHVHYLQETPRDSLYSKMYNLNNKGQTGGTHDADIDAPEAWEITTGSKKVLVGVIDTGVDYKHPDLKDNYWKNPGETGKDQNGRDKRRNGIDDDKNGYIDDHQGWDFYSNNNDPMDGHSHGTHCAGTIGASGNNRKGVTGINWNVSLVGLKVFSDSGKTNTAAIAEAIEYSTKIAVDVTNNSWGSNTYSKIIKAAIDQARRKKIAFIAAAGNNNENNNTKPFYPASYKFSNVISVAATDHNDRLASFSNFGSNSVDVGAPGVQIYSTFPKRKYEKISGTSMAAPHVTGLYALIKAKHPKLSYRAIKERILSSGDKVRSLRGKTRTGRRINALNALK